MEGFDDDTDLQNKFSLVQYFVLTIVVITLKKE